jgi:hypothetical protein
MSQLRPVARANMEGVTPGGSVADAPVFRWVKPEDLQVDEAYQRQLSERSLTLIRRIVADWDWRRFKPPIVAMCDNVLTVIDGQHTAIAAASHPLVAEIPVMVVMAETQASQAAAFVGQNKDRLQLTPMQLHHAAVSAGDVAALELEALCAAAGVRVLLNPVNRAAAKPRETMAVGALKELLAAHGRETAAVVLGVVADAGCAPVMAAQLKAVALLVTDAEYRDLVKPDQLTAVLAETETVEKEARLFAATHGLHHWKALALTLFRKARTGRRG